MVHPYSRSRNRTVSRVKSASRLAGVAAARKARPICVPTSRQERELVEGRVVVVVGWCRCVCNSTKSRNASTNPASMATTSTSGPQSWRLFGMGVARFAVRVLARSTTMAEAAATSPCDHVRRIALRAGSGADPMRCRAARSVSS